MQPLYIIDKETTGLNPALNAPIEISCLVLGGEHDGKNFTGKMRPFTGARIEAPALAANGYDYEEIMAWPEPSEVFANFNEWLLMVVPANQTARPCGYNFKFDDAFLREWYCRHGDATQYSFTFDPVCVEVMDVIRQTWPEHVGTKFPKKGGMKLTFQHLFHFGREHHKAHTALADCIATRSLFLHADRHSGRNEYADFHQHIPELPANTLS